MSVQSKEEFKDPALKEAVRRCWACDCASEHLRKRVAAMLDDNQAAGAPRRSMQMDIRRPWMLWPLATAAAVLISVTLFNRYRSSSQPAPIGLQSADVQLASLESDLIKTHDRCCKMAHHQGLSVPINDDVAIADRLRATLQQPVLVYHPQDSAWVFRGASLCHVGQSKTGHLVFVKGDDALSIFSLSKKRLPDLKEGSQFSSMVDGHPIVGFVKDGALFCVVGSGPAGTVSVDELEQMTQRMKPVVAESPRVEPTGVELTELLQPVR